MRQHQSTVSCDGKSLVNEGRLQGGATLLNQRWSADAGVQGTAGVQDRSRIGAVVLSYMCMTYSPPALGAGGSKQKPNRYVLSLRLHRTSRV